MNGTPVAGLVSVVIPVFNYEAYLGQAIDSVLAQTYSPVEVMVVDDGSTDGSAAVAMSYGAPVLCIRQANGGLGAARNAGVDASRGEYLAFLDADDYWAPQKLELQVAMLKQAPELDAVFGQVRQFRSDDATGEFDLRTGDSLAVHSGSMLARRSSFLRVGPFASGLRSGEFLDWYARAQEAGIRTRVLGEVVLHRRVHGRNMVLTEPGSREEYVRVLRAALTRRRAARG